MLGETRREATFGVCSASQHSLHSSLLLLFPGEVSRRLKFIDHSVSTGAGTVRTIARSGASQSMTSEHASIIILLHPTDYLPPTNNPTIIAPTPGPPPQSPLPPPYLGFPSSHPHSSPYPHPQPKSRERVAHAPSPPSPSPTPHPPAPPRRPT